MFPLNILDAETRRRGLRYVVIGGHAVNAYCAPRATLDVDLLVLRSDLSAWRDLIEAEGFRVLNVGENFLQFSPPYGVAWRLDLMLVNNQTFEQLYSTAQSKEWLGITSRIADPASLIALKLHSARHGPVHRRLKDISDIANLMRALGITLESDTMSEMLMRYGSHEIRDEIGRQLDGR